MATAAFLALRTGEAKYWACYDVYNALDAA